MAATTVLGGIAATALAAGTVVAAGPAHADDREVRTGACSRNADYRMVLADRDDRRDDRDRLRTGFRVDGPRAGAVWTVTVKRNGTVVHRATKRANDRGNVAFARTFRGDDDAYVKVVVRSGYGERCGQRMRLDD